MIRVLFVCLGNICRSPMAEAVFRHEVEAAGLGDRIDIDSAGTGGWHIGEEPHEGTRRKLAEKNISTAGMKGRQLSRQDLETFDYIIAMDAENLGDIHRLAAHDSSAYTARLLDLVPDSDIEDVPDPYFTGNFDEVYGLIEDGCRRLLALIREREDL